MISSVKRADFFYYRINQNVRSTKFIFFKIRAVGAVPSSISGGSPPTNTLREKRSFVSDVCECGEDRDGEFIDNNPLDSSAMWSSFRLKNGFPELEADMRFNFESIRGKFLKKN